MCRKAKSEDEKRFANQIKLLTVDQVSHVLDIVEKHCPSALKEVRMVAGCVVDIE